MEDGMRRLILALFGAATAMVGPTLAASTAGAAELCVGHRPHCHPTIKAALDASHDGDVIRIRPGRFAGGFTINRSVKLLGAGPGETIIRGGGPVVTIGVLDALSEPTVTIKGVTITGGVTSSSGQCGPVCGTNYVQATALGGGIEIPPAAGSTTGATVTIRDSVVTGNRVAPTVTVPSVRATCSDLPCRFALSGGGGIDNWGTLTLTNTTVSDNEVGDPLASDAVGAGILNEAGSLTLRNSVVKGNRAIASAPNGRFAEGGGIFASSGALTIDASLVRDNHASLSSSFPDGVDMNAHGGGIHVGDDGSATVESSRISGNTVTVNDPFGQPAGFDAGIYVGTSPLVMRNSTVSDNRVTATVRSTADAGPSGSALEFGGEATITNTRITGNTAIVTSPAGVAGVAGAVAAFSQGPTPALMIGSVIAGNNAKAFSSTGSATVQGVGIVNNGLLELRNDLITGNSGTASGPDGFAQGGGIWNDVLFFDPPVQLTLEHTVVAHNSLAASPGLAVQGGGLFTSFPVTLSNSLIARNTPDQCHGCAITGPTALQRQQRHEAASGPRG
jgi:hypothetical protein